MSYLIECKRFSEKIYDICVSDCRGEGIDLLRPNGDYWYAAWCMTWSWSKSSLAPIAITWHASAEMPSSLPVISPSKSSGQLLLQG